MAEITTRLLRTGLKLALLLFLLLLLVNIPFVGWVLALILLVPLIKCFIEFFTTFTTAMRRTWSEVRRSFTTPLEVTPTHLEVPRGTYATLLVRAEESGYVRVRSTPPHTRVTPPEFTVRSGERYLLRLWVSPRAVPGRYRFMLEYRSKDVRTEVPVYLRILHHLDTETWGRILASLEEVLRRVRERVWTTTRPSTLLQVWRELRYVHDLLEDPENVPDLYEVVSRLRKLLET